MTPFAVFSPALATGAAVAAVGVPLIIHLLFRKRYQIVPWAAVRFLLVAERRHRRRIDQWLLLTLRALALLLPLFAMLAATSWAEPLWQSIKPGATETIANVPRTHHILVLDASLSMTARTDDGRTRFEKALAQAENLVRSAGPGDGFTVLALASGQPIVPGPSNDPEKVVAELRKVKPTHAPADTAAVLPAIAEALVRGKRAYPRRQVTFLTDLQKSAWANVPPRPDAELSEAAKQIFRKTDVDVVITDLARTDFDNLAVVDVALGDPLPFVDSAGVVNVVVANFGRIEKRDVKVQLFVGRPSANSDSLVPVEQQTVKVIPAGDRTRLTFGLEGQVRFREKGIHVVQVKLLEPDDLPADDSRTVAVQVRDGLRAVLVDGKLDPVPNRRAAWDLRRALLPKDESTSLTPARPQVMTPKEFADPDAGDLTGVDCVYLCDLANPTPDIVAKLEAVLKRGGGVVIGLGPNAAANRAAYNRLLFNDGNGILPNPLGDVVTVSGPDDPGFRLAAEDEDYLRPPLQFFRDEKIRGGLIMAPFKSYIRLDPPPRKNMPNTPSPESIPSDGPARRVLSFVAGGNPGPSSRRPDAALVEWNRHRGRVVVFTSSFNEDWNDWPPLPSYLMFHQELLRFAAASPDRHTVQVGDFIEEFYPPAAAGLTAQLTAPDGSTASVALTMQDEAAFARFPDTTRLSGIYRLRVEGNPDRVFAVNQPEGAPGAASESDLKRLDPAELKSLGPVQVVNEVGEVKATTDSGATITSAPKPHGPMIARFAVMAALLVLVAEMLVAWRWGPSRATGVGIASGSVRPVERKLYIRILSTVGALVPLAVAVFLLGTLAHYERTGDLLGFLPASARESIEVAAGVPAAQHGEGTKWRLEGFTAFARNGLTDRRIVLALAGIGVFLTALAYFRERRVVASICRLIVPGLLRVAVFLLALFVLLPQVRLAFDREGWPEVVILIDTSGSMDTVDNFKDPAVLAKAEQLVGAAGLPQAQRLKLAQLLLTRSSGTAGLQAVRTVRADKEADWLDRLLKEKEVKVHIYAVDSGTRPVASMEQPTELEEGRAALLKLTPTGDSSKLGEGVEAVLKAFRGGSLAAIIMFTDGVTTAGDDLPKAARSAAAAGVPLYLVGVGDAWERPDLELTDLQAEDTITVGDRLVFDLRLVAHGQIPPGPVTVTLTEKGQPPEKARRATATVTPDPSGNRVPITLAHTPMEPGEKTFVIEVPAVEGETDKTNNRIERTVLVTDSKRVRVLYIESYPRYDFRFAKVLLERESDRSVGGKGAEVKVVLLGASKGWETTDRSAYQIDKTGATTEMPTREELFGFDVIVLGDVDPKQFTRPTSVLQNLADFVRVKGGGLLFLSGEHGSPAAYADTPLADVLPVIPDPAAGRAPDDALITESFRPKITPAGRQHPLFRFSPDDAESLAIWNRLQPLYWYAKGYRRKPNTVVLAVHPDRPAEGAGASENHPLVIQAFAGAGPVLFYGFDDTWRWRFRNDEEYFDRFWVQTVRVLSQSRVRRVELKVSPKGEFRRDEKMTVVLRFPVESPAPPPGQPVRVGFVRGPLLNPDGTPGNGPSEAITLTLARVPGPGVQYETTLTHTPEGEYRFTLIDPETPPGLSAPTAVARVLPPLGERERVELNKPDLAAAAAISNGGFYTLPDAEKVFDDLKNLQRVPLNQPCPPVELWNSPEVYLLLALLLAAEWMLRKRERLL